MRPRGITIGIVSDIVLRTDEETEYAFSHAKKIADKVDAEKYLNMPRPYSISFGQKMYGYGRGSLDIVQPFYDEYGILTVNIYDFLLVPSCLEK